MSEKKNLENDDLKSLVAGKLAEKAENELLDEAFGEPSENVVNEDDPDYIIKNKPLQSIAESMYHIERTLKAMLYIQNCNADHGLTYNREHFYGILGGPDPELLAQLELERIIKAQASAKQ